MKVLGWNDSLNTDAVFALGFFDGVHLGHRAVIESAVAKAKELGLISAVFTFTSGKKTEKGSIYPLNRRLELFEEMGVDFALVPDFAEFSSLSPKQFLDTLKNNFKAVAFCCGENFKYGKNASGDINSLKDYAQDNGCEVIINDAVKLRGKRVSSSRIRELFLEGSIEEANSMLGREYSVKGKVIKGKQIGTKSLYPTINLPLFEGSASLKRGVYASKTKIDGRSYKSITNIGVCPTVKDEGKLSFETYILDEELSLYDKDAEVFLEKFIREEKKFESAEELKRQITLDIKSI